MQNFCKTGPEVPAMVIHMEPGSRLRIHTRICFANTRYRLWIEPDLGTSHLLADETGKSEIVVPLNGLMRGGYFLWWSFQTASEKWQTEVDVIVSDQLRLRRQKSSDGKNPVNMGFVRLDVK